MVRSAAILLIASCAAAVAAHPFDDRCDMVAQVILTTNSKTKSEEIVLQVQYRYETPYASYNEAYLSLDADRDEHVTRAELDARFETLASDLLASVYLAIRGDAATIEPDKSNFAFADLDNPDAGVDQAGGMPVRKLRIGYFFYFNVKPAYALDAGKHPVEFYLANRRVAITDPADQLQAWDDRGPERKAITTVKHDRTADKYDRLNFLWEMAVSTPAVTPEPEIKPTPEDPKVEPKATGKEQLIETDKQRHEESWFDVWTDHAFESLRNNEADPTVWLVVLGIMLVLGGYHAMMPGHGKTLVASYLIGTQGTKADALFLGLVVTAAHTSGVFMLMGGAWAASEFWPNLFQDPKKELTEWIALAVGATILLMGAGLVMKRAGGKAKHEHDIFGRHVHDHEHGNPEDSDILEPAHSHDHGDDHGHSHDHGHDHHHHDPAKMTRWEILRLGILGGVIPCPSAFMIGLIAFQQQWYASGLILVFAFSVGLAAVLATIGLVLVKTKSYLHEKQQKRGTVYQFLEAKLPVFGALVITLIGAVMVLMAMIRLDLIDPAKFTV